jgi:predicted nucleotidyltransferase component of viral defense system
VGESLGDPAEKLHALGNRTAARDLYDVWFLLERGVMVDFPMLMKKFSYYDEKFDAGKMVGNARRCKESWTRDLGHLVRELPAYHPVEKAVENTGSQRLFGDHDAALVLRFQTIDMPPSRG